MEREIREGKKDEIEAKDIIPQISDLCRQVVGEPINRRVKKWDYTYGANSIAITSDFFCYYFTINSESYLINRGRLLISSAKRFMQVTDVKKIKEIYQNLQQAINEYKKNQDLQKRVQSPLPPSISESERFLESRSYFSSRATTPDVIQSTTPSPYSNEGGMTDESDSEMTLSSESVVYQKSINDDDLEIKSQQDLAETEPRGDLNGGFSNRTNPEVPDNIIKVETTKPEEVSLQEMPANILEFKGVENDAKFTHRHRSDWIEVVITPKNSADSVQLPIVVSEMVIEDFLNGETMSERQIKHTPHLIHSMAQHKNNAINNITILINGREKTLHESLCMAGFDSIVNPNIKLVELLEKIKAPEIKNSPQKGHFLNNSPVTPSKELSGTIYRFFKRMSLNKTNTTSLGHSR